MLNIEEAVRLAAEAWAPLDDLGAGKRVGHAAAAAAVAAALPALAEQFAALIEADCRNEWHEMYYDYGEERPTLCLRCSAAARLVRESLNA